MTELERHPYAVRQGAAAAAVAVVTVAALPMMASRAEDQRNAAAAAGASVAVHSVVPSSVQLSAHSTPQGWRAHGSASLDPSHFRSPSIIVQASLKPTLPPVGAPAVLRSPDLKTASFQAREQHCLSQAIYFEARGEGRTGQLAVAEVVANRVQSSLYPNTYCGVVYQGSTRVTGCQFSFTCDGSLNRSPRGIAWRQAQALAREVILEGAPSMTFRATHYHADHVTPYWSSSLVETTRIGSHVFYRLPTRKEKALLTAAQVEIEPPVVDELLAPPIGFEGEVMSPPLVALDAEPTESAPEPVEPPDGDTVALDPQIIGADATAEVGV